MKNMVADYGIRVPKIRNVLFLDHQTIEDISKQSKPTLLGTI